MLVALLHDWLLQAQVRKQRAAASQDQQKKPKEHSILKESKKHGKALHQRKPGGSTAQPAADTKQTKKQAKKS